MVSVPNTGEKQEKLCSLLLVGFCLLFCLVAKSCLTIFDPMDCSPPGSTIHGIPQARILEQVAISSSRDRPDSGSEPMSPALAGGFFTTEPTWESGLDMKFCSFDNNIIL